MILQVNYINLAEFVQIIEFYVEFMQVVDETYFICYNKPNKSNQGGQDYEKQRFTVIAA